MPNAFALHLPCSTRRYRGSVALYFANAARTTNIRIQCQLPELFGVFGEGCGLAIRLCSDHPCRSDGSTAPEAAEDQRRLVKAWQGFRFRPAKGDIR